MKFIPQAIPEVILIDPVIHPDYRGFFMETYRLADFSRAGIPNVFVQQNHLRSARGVLRGLHYQLHNPQGKLIRVISGEIFDVAVDLRSSSPTLGKWVGNTLSSETSQQIWVPPGFAHGIYILSEFAEVLYQTTDYYHPEDKHTIRWNDTDLAINWPLVNGNLVILSTDDRTAPGFHEAQLYTE
ncbi:MAG TPA: dTDP-4-dehydrorhamnose 3,5-epimerase [Anaerolineaceae bacterium]|nr:dTDP-4-dehydrorhamnose 3,5-epimerase [Anaerolineaceae bacterium]